jgi:ribonucleoside-diphosphate reductase alpha chain
MTIQEWLGADNQLGIDIWHKKYQYNGESFDNWLDRVSNGSETVKKLILDKKFLFGGRILASRGIQNFNPEAKTTYSNCYVLDAPYDNLESIFDCAKNLARTYSYGGGVGIDLSRLAPKGSKVRNAAKESSGAVSFMDLYSMVTGLIAQAGRRGALMISMDCDHPDIEEFIDIKKDLDKVTKANISVKVTDDFMEAAINNNTYELSFTREETGETITKTVNARDLLMKLAYNNWDMGEPGVLFWDRIKEWNMLSEYENFEYAGVNPCAEEPLPAGGSCLLGSLNLAEFVTDGKFDFEALDQAAYDATIALNEVLDEGLALHPLKIQRESVRDWRQIGLGVFGIADMLIKVGVRYGSDESIMLCDKIAQHILNNSICASAYLANYYNSCFPKFDINNTRHSDFYRSVVWPNTDEIVCRNGLRNSQLLTIAPTGTLSTMLGVSGGIEPIFANSYTRKTESLHSEDHYYKVYTPIVAEYMAKHGIDREENLPDFFVVSKDLDYRARISMQSVWQRYIDASISSTVNLPVDATPEDVFNIYVDAWMAGLKGITVFRDGCRRASILSTTPSQSEEAKSYTDILQRGEVVPAHDSVVGKKRKLTTGCGSLHVTAFFDATSGDLMETYLSKGSTGGCNNYMIGLSRMISLAARSGCSIHNIIDQLNSTGVCPSYAVRKATKHDTSKGSCCPMAVGNALLEMWEEMKSDLGESKHNVANSSVRASEPAEDHVIKCPECGEPIIHEGGCDICKACGWSKCG